MNTAEFQSLVRKAMNDERMWAELTAPSEDARDVLAVLLDWRTSVKDDRERWKARVSALSSERQMGAATADDVHRLNIEYADWRRRVAGFDRVLTKRVSELQRRFSAATTDVQRRQRKVAQNTMQTLALAIYAHQSEELSDAELYERLDSLSFDFGRHGRLTLREAIEQEVIAPERTVIYADAVAR